jgi:Na+/H+-dicarboxylate symporter
MKIDRLTYWVSLALIAGLVLGASVHALQWQNHAVYLFVRQVLDFGSHAFLSLLKLLVVPVVFVSLVCGVGAAENITRLGRLGLQTMGAYLVTTALALVIALLLAGYFEPGVGFENSNVVVAEFKVQGLNWLDTLKKLVPSNFVQAFLEMDMMQVIFISLLLGTALAKTQPRTEMVLNFFEQLNTLLNEWVLMTLKLAPLGVFCLMTEVFAQKGIQFLGPLTSYFVVVMMGLLIHLGLVYFSLLKWGVGVSPLSFLKKFKSVMLFAFSTSSSQATLSLNMAVTEKNLGVARRVTSFTLPLGATVNMDGTAIMQGVATLFIAQVYGIELTFIQLLTVVVMATLASIGTAGVPGVGLVTLSMVLEQVGLPIEGIGLILGVDRLLDMLRTVVNITGDTVVTLWVAKNNQAWDRGVYETETR